jgi:tripartite-type tricarboxylate transporter receptor subunit TctC
MIRRFFANAGNTCAFTLWSFYRVQIANPFPPGAVTALMARLIAGKLTVSLGQSTIVVDKNGGNGAIGLKTVRDC